jgi:hypothetical protein
MAAGPVTAAMGCIICVFTGFTAAGISKFQRGRAGFPVADITFVVLVNFSTCTGFFIDTTPSYGGNWFIVFGFVCCLFWHCVYPG